MFKSIARTHEAALFIVSAAFRKPRPFSHIFDATPRVRTLRKLENASRCTDRLDGGGDGGVASKLVALIGRHVRPSHFPLVSPCRIEPVGSLYRRDRCENDGTLKIRIPPSVLLHKSRRGIYFKSGGSRLACNRRKVPLLNEMGDDGTEIRLPKDGKHFRDVPALRYRRTLISFGETWAVKL